LTKPDNFFAVLKGGFHVLNYAFVAEKAQRRAELFLSDPDKMIARNVWSLPESGIVRPFIDLIMPPIKCMEILYIPRHFPQITLERVGEWVSTKNFGIVERARE